jgi:alpha-amylase
VLTSTLNKVRNHLIHTSDAYFESAAETVRSDTNHLCLKKGPDGHQVVFCIDNKSSKGDNYQLLLSGFQSGDEVTEVLGCTHTTADGTGSFKSFQFDGEPRVYVSKAALQDSGICLSTVEAKAKEKWCRWVWCCHGSVGGCSRSRSICVRGFLGAHLGDPLSGCQPG